MQPVYSQSISDMNDRFFQAKLKAAFQSHDTIHDEFETLAAARAYYTQQTIPLRCMAAKASMKGFIDSIQKVMGAINSLIDFVMNEDSTGSSNKYEQRVVSGFDQVLELAKDVNKLLVPADKMQQLVAFISLASKYIPKVVQHVISKRTDLDEEAERQHDGQVNQLIRILTSTQDIFQDLVGSTRPDVYREYLQHYQNDLTEIARSFEVVLQEVDPPTLYPQLRRHCDLALDQLDQIDEDFTNRFSPFSQIFSAIYPQFHEIRSSTDRLMLVTDTRDIKTTHKSIAKLITQIQKTNTVLKQYAIHLR